MSDPRLTSVTLASEITGYGERTLRRMCSDGRIPDAVLVGRTWVIPYRWAAEHADSCEPLDGYIPLAEAALKMRITREAARQLCERGTLRGRKRMVDRRGHWLIDEADMNRYIMKKLGYIPD